jgi:hypothetical protein
MWRVLEPCRRELYGIKIKHFHSKSNGIIQCIRSYSFVRSDIFWHVIHATLNSHLNLLYTCNANLRLVNVVTANILATSQLSMLILNYTFGSNLIDWEPGQPSRYSDWLWAGRPRGQSWSPSRGKIFLLSMSRLVLGPTQPPIQWVPQAFSPGVKRTGHEADHSPPTSAEVKNT